MEREDRWEWEGGVGVYHPIRNNISEASLKYNFRVDFYLKIIEIIIKQTFLINVFHVQ